MADGNEDQRTRRSTLRSFAAGGAAAWAAPAILSAPAAAASSAPPGTELAYAQIDTTNPQLVSEGDVVRFGAVQTSNGMVTLGFDGSVVIPNAGVYRIQYGLLSFTTGTFDLVRSGSSTPIGFGLVFQQAEVYQTVENLVPLVAGDELQVRRTGPAIAAYVTRSSFVVQQIA